MPLWFIMVLGALALFVISVLTGRRLQKTIGAEIETDNFTMRDLAESLSVLGIIVAVLLFFAGIGVAVAS